jgi:hypothetical protein
MDELNNSTPNTRYQQEMLARLDERTKSMQTDIIASRNDQKVALDNLRLDLKQALDSINLRVADLERDNVTKFRELDTKYVSKEEFGPVQKLVYSFVRCRDPRCYWNPTVHRFEVSAAKKPHYLFHSNIYLPLTNDNGRITPHRLN